MDTSNEILRLFKTLDANTGRAIRAQILVAARMNCGKLLGDGIDGSELVEIEDFINEAIKADWVLSLSRIWLDYRDDSFAKLHKNNEWGRLLGSHPDKIKLTDLNEKIGAILGNSDKRLDLLSFARVEGLAHATENANKRERTGQKKNLTIGMLSSLTDETSDIVCSIREILSSPRSKANLEDMKSNFQLGSDLYFSLFCNFDHC